MTFTNRQKHTKWRLDDYLHQLVFIHLAFLPLSANRPHTEVPEICKGWETHFKALLECYLIEHVVFNANENDLSRTKCSFEGGVVWRHFQISGKTWCHRYTTGQILQFTRLVHALQQCCCVWNESNIVHTSGAHTSRWSRLVRNPLFAIWNSSLLKTP